MSALTKVFVTLLIVCSLMFVAATVVYVNIESATIETQKRTLDSERAAKLRAEDAERQTSAAKQAAVDYLNQAMEQKRAAEAEARNATMGLSERDARIAELRSQLAQQTLALGRATEGLKSSEELKTQLLNQVADLRKGNDDLMRRNVELNQTLSDTTNKLDVTTRDWRYLKEQLAEAQGQTDKLGKALRDRGVNPSEIQVAGVAAGAPPINGVIRTVKPIAGIDYATISVGTADSVAKGMRFNVIDRDRGDFLGVLTVDSVEANEATGRLAGPRIKDIRAGSEVRTQL